MKGRCSTEKQKENLDRQVERLELWCKENNRDEYGHVKNVAQKLTGM